MRFANVPVEVCATQGKVRLRLGIEATLPALIGDERAIKQVLLNLIANAVKFTEGGDVTIFARRNDDGGLDLGVADTGVGIDPADRARVFEMFGQGRYDIAQKEKGAGLGLPIARRLMAARLA